MSWINFDEIDEISQIQKIIRMQQKEELHPDLVPFVMKGDGINGSDCIRHPLVFCLSYHTGMNAMLNDQYKTKKELLDKCLNEKKYINYIMLHERPHQLEKFAEIENLLSDKEYWNILRRIWIMSENIWQYAKFISRFMNSKRSSRCAIMEEEEQEFLSNLPDEFTIYRGHHGINKIGYSWTLNYLTAKWFAERFDQKRKGVLKAIVKKRDVIAIFLSRNEFEIIVEPDNLSGITSIPLEMKKSN